MFTTFHVHVLTILAIVCPMFAQKVQLLDKCRDLREPQPDAVLPDTKALRCTTVTDDKNNSLVTWDNERLLAGSVPFFTVFQGNLRFYNNTPSYCFDRDNNVASFNLNFDSTLPRQKVRAETTSCRAGGHWTNGTIMCAPPGPECANVNLLPSTKYYEEELHVTLNMADVANIKAKRTVVLTQFHGASDPRFVYNQTSNQTEVLSSEEFFKYCTLYGPCERGKFLGANYLFDLFAGFPPLYLKRDKRGSVYIGVRNDPRMFGLLEKDKPRPCLFKRNLDYELCEPPVGLHSWTKLWKTSLPYHKEWLALHWFVRWSYKQDCIIRVTDNDTGDILVDFKCPCGRHYEMKMGDFPYPKVGLYIPGGVEVPISMRYRDTKFIFHGSGKESDFSK